MRCNIYTLLTFFVIRIKEIMKRSIRYKELSIYLKSEREEIEKYY